MTSLTRKPLVTLLTAAAVSAALGIAGAPVALADDDSQPQPPNDGFGNAISSGPETYGKIAQYPLVDPPKLAFNPPTDRPHAQAGSNSGSGDSDNNSNNDEGDN
jgi:hypothetical protein